MPWTFASTLRCVAAKRPLHCESKDIGIGLCVDWREREDQHEREQRCADRHGIHDDGVGGQTLARNSPISVMEFAGVARKALSLRDWNGIFLGTANG
jgi:hypothetical protein